MTRFRITRTSEKIQKAKDMRARVEAELERIRGAPTVDPEEISKHRRELGISQHQLAAASGVDVGTISRIERGFDRYKPESLRFIAAGLEFIREFTRDAEKTETC